MAEVQRVRRKISMRLMDAQHRGKLHEEIQALERKGERACREENKGRHPAPPDTWESRVHLLGSRHRNLPGTFRLSE